jgi:hypothetical protein
MQRLKKYKQFLNENNEDFDFLKIFLELTEYTIPYGYEEKLEPILYKYIPGLKKDSIGNYFIKIGQSKTIFTSHLDVYTKRYEKVNHFVRRGVVKTDETTALVDEFSGNNLKFKQDYAYGTDSAVFLDVVPEITNISSGGSYEHSFLESTDIKYLKKVANAAININWESLPTVRKPEAISTQHDDKEHEKEIIEESRRTFNKVVALLATKGFNCLNSNHFILFLLKNLKIS